MKKVICLFMIIILAGCADKGPGTVNNSVEIITKIGKLYGLNYEKKVLDDGTKWFSAQLHINTADSMELKIKNSIDNELGMNPTSSVENEFQKTDKYSYILDTYTWETPKMKLEMRFTQDMIKSAEEKYFITFRVFSKK